MRCKVAMGCEVAVSEYARTVAVGGWPALACMRRLHVRCWRRDVWPCYNAFEGMAELGLGHARNGAPHRGWQPSCK